MNAPVTSLGVVAGLTGGRKLSRQISHEGKALAVADTMFGTLFLLIKNEHSEQTTNEFGQGCELALLQYLARDWSTEVHTLSLHA